MASAAEQWASSAALNAALKYHPQLEGLADLKREAEERFSSSVRAGKSEGTLASQAAQGAIAPTQQIFQQAGAEAGRSRALTSPALSALGPDNPFTIAAGNEQAAGGERLAQSQAHALSDLQARKAAAGELPVFTRQAALAQLLKDMTSISGKQQAIRGAEGATVQSEVDRQRTEANKEAAARAREERKDAFTKQLHGEPTYKDLHPTGSGPGEVKPQSPAAQAKSASTIKAILDLAKTGIEHGESRAELVARLSRGRPQQTIGVNAKGEPIKEGEKALQHVPLAAVPAYRPDTLMSAALDIAQFGHVSAHYQHQLEAEGYDPHRLGVPLEPRPVSVSPQVGKGISDTGKRVARALSGL